MITSVFVRNLKFDKLTDKETLEKVGTNKGKDQAKLKWLTFCTISTVRKIFESRLV